MVSEDVSGVILVFAALYVREFLPVASFKTFFFVSDFLQLNVISLCADVLGTHSACCS